MFCSKCSAHLVSGNLWESLRALTTCPGGMRLQLSLTFIQVGQKVWVCAQGDSSHLSNESLQLSTDLGVCATKPFPSGWGRMGLDCCLFVYIWCTGFRVCSCIMPLFVFVFHIFYYFLNTKQNKATNKTITNLIYIHYKITKLTGHYETIHCTTRGCRSIIYLTHTLCSINSFKCPVSQIQSNKVL